MNKLVLLIASLKIDKTSLVCNTRYSHAERISWQIFLLHIYTLYIFSVNVYQRLSKYRSSYSLRVCFTIFCSRLWGMNKIFLEVILMLDCIELSFLIHISEKFYREMRYCYYVNANGLILDIVWNISNSFVDSALYYYNWFQN